MRIIFMGTPDLASSVLKTMLEAGLDVSLVVTQPDRQKGRGKSVVKTPVKILAEEWNIPVFQPVRVRTPEAVARLREEKADLIVVAAFGQILSKEILDLPPYGCVNVHTSLLPMYRGAAPIQWVILNGEKYSGVTIMKMDEGLDTGPILLQEKLELDPKETGESLYDKLSLMGGKLLLKAIEGLQAGTLTPVPQEGENCYASMLKKEMGDIDWTWSAEKTERFVRGLNSWPSAYTRYQGKILKIWDADVIAEESGAAPGTVVRTDKAAIYVACGQETLALKEVQIEGKKRMPVSAFLLGYHVKAGDILG